MVVTARTSVSRVDFGNFMERLRKRSGRTHARAGLHLGEVSRYVIGRLEEGEKTNLTTPQITSLLEFYGVTDQEKTEALELWGEIQKQTKIAKAQGESRGFWTEYIDQIAPNYRKFLRLEQICDHVVAYHPVIVPGLLQGPDYRRAIIRIEDPKLSAVDVERRVELTGLRQARLDESSLQVVILVTEAVLRNIVGSASVMAGQLKWMTELGNRDNIAIQLIPFEVASHRGLTILPFTRLGFAQGESGLTKAPLVYAEGAFSISYHEREDIVADYDKAIAALRTVALNEEDTRSALVRAAREYEA